MQPIETARRILLCLRYGIGDVVMETPILEALRRAAPSARITGLAAEPAVELLREDPRLDLMVSAGRWGLRHRWDRGDGEARAAIADWVRESGFDVYLDVHHAVEAVGEAIWAQGIRSYEADEAVEAAAVTDGTGAVAAIKEAVRAGWGIPVGEEAAPRLHVSPRARAFANRFVRDRSPGGRPVAISPVASLPMKRWPTSRFAELADGLAERTDGAVLLFSGPQVAHADEVMAAMSRPERVVRVGELDLGLVAGLLRCCEIFVANDTGLMHMAAAVGTPTIGIFGPTSPRVFLPPVRARGVGGWRIECPYRHASSLHPPGCWTSGHCLIAEESCITGVSVEEVLAAVDAVRVRRETSTRTPTAIG